MWWSDRLTERTARRRRPVAAALTLVGTLVVLGPLAGCGFHPLYGQDSTGGNTGAEIQSIAINQVVEQDQPRTAQLVRNALLDRLNPNGPPARPVYQLSVNLTETKTLLAITQAEQVTRTSLNLTATYSLADARTGKIIHQGTAQAITAYNVLRIDYGNVVVEKDARARLSRQIAEKIRGELAAWLQRPGAPVR